MKQEGASVKTELRIKGNIAKRFIAASLITFIIVTCFTRVVMADMGPKRSIEIKILNAPTEPYYVALLMPTDYVADIDDPSRFDHIPEDKDWVREIFYEYDEDGFRLFTYPAGTNSICYSGWQNDFYRGENIIEYGYMVPSTFKVMIVTDSGEVTVSNELTAKRFHSQCEYDYSTNTLKEIIVPAYGPDFFIETALYLVVTLVIEGIVLLCFGLFRKKNLKYFLIVNITTQFLLFVFNFLSRMFVVVLLNHFALWIVMEAVILVIETIWYSKKLVNKNGDVSKVRNILYAITANLISAFIDLPILLIVAFIWPR